MYIVTNVPYNLMMIYYKSLAILASITAIT